MNEDTLHLLSECAAGTDMAIRSLDDVLKNSPDGPLQRRLASSKRQHESLAAETKALLRAQGKEAKSADPAARAMSWMKTEAMLAMKPGDATTADLISTGCSMGIKSLARYCNQYPTASRELLPVFFCSCASFWSKDEFCPITKFESDASAM